MLWLHAYHQIHKHCAYLYYDAIPNILEKGNNYPSLSLSQLVWIVKTAIVMASNNHVQKLAKFEKCNSKSYKQPDILWNDECHLPLRQCKRSNSILLVYVTLELIPKANPPNKYYVNEYLRNNANYISGFTTIRNQSYVHATLDDNNQRESLEKWYC